MILYYYFRIAKTGVGVRMEGRVTMCLVLAGVPQAGRDHCVKSPVPREHTERPAVTSVSVRTADTVIT